MKVKDYTVKMLKRIFGENIELEHMIFICVAISGIFMAGAGIIGNFSLNLNAVTLLIPGINIVLDIICIAYSKTTKKWKVPSVLVIFYAVFILFPFLWFSTGGATGSTMPFLIMAGLVVVIGLKGKMRAVVLVVMGAMFAAFIYLEMLYPDIVVAYPTREAQYIDLLMGFLLSFSVTVGLSYIVLSRYRRAKQQAENLVHQLEAYALTDPLTGVYNRRYLMTCIDEEMRRSYDTGAPLAVCILDLDLFKNINDTYGHVYGDHVLIELSRTISGCMKKNEIFGRYGGEEFLVIFKDSTPADAVETIGRFYRALSEIQWEHGESITISCGVSVYTKAISYSKFIEDADTNLYLAKGNGRDQVMMNGERVEI